jgi:2-methylcitrate dehydratase PrpD
VTLAEAFLYGKVDAESFGAARLRDPRILALAERITHVIDADAPGREQWRGWVQVTLRDGTRRERVQPYNWGSPQNPLSQADIEAKFRSNAVPVIGPARADAVIAKAAALATLPAITELTALCVSAPA